MSKSKIFRFIVFTALAVISLFIFASCANAQESLAQDNASQEGVIQETIEKEPTNLATTQDIVSSRIKLGKKYYYLGYDGYSENEYYSFSQDGTATYTHVMKNGNATIFHQIINFKWTYAGEGECIMAHNGTAILKGEQDEAFGIARVMKISSDIIYWSASGENTYYICEDFLSQIPNYAKLI